MSNNRTGFKQFYAASYTASYESEPLQVSPVGNQSVVFQANLSSGDSVTLQGRVDPSFPFVDILTASNDPYLQEVTTCVEYRVVVTNGSGSSVTCGVCA